MNNIDIIKNEIKNKIEQFQIVNASSLDTLVESSMPYYELEDCETIEDIIQWLDDFIFTVKDNMDIMNNFLSRLEDFQEKIEGEE